MIRSSRAALLPWSAAEPARVADAHVDARLAAAAATAVQLARVTVTAHRLDAGTHLARATEPAATTAMHGRTGPR